MVATTGAVIEDNLVTSSRAISGISVAVGAAVLTRKMSRAHSLHGILVFTGSRADMRDNVFEDNGLAGILIDLNPTARSPTISPRATPWMALSSAAIRAPRSSTTSSRTTAAMALPLGNCRRRPSVVAHFPESPRWHSSGRGHPATGPLTAAIGLDDEALLERARMAAGLLVVDDGLTPRPTSTAARSCSRAMPQATWWATSVMSLQDREDRARLLQGVEPSV